MSTLAQRIAKAIADPIDVSEDYPYDGVRRVVIGLEPADLDELLAAAGIELS